MIATAMVMLASHRPLLVRRVLGELGINSQAPLENYRDAMARFLPACVVHVETAVRDAGATSARDEHHWLVEHLVLAPPPAGDLSQYASAWALAEQASGVRDCPPLDHAARSAVLDRLCASDVSLTEALATGMQHHGRDAS